MIYDAAIIGTGPAGLSAALTIKLHQKALLWFGNKGMSEKIRQAEKVSNYPGMPCVSGEDMAQADMYEAKTIVLATGVVNTANIKGESEFLGKGVSYCATCDGTIYRGKTIAVLSSSPHFEHEVKYLADLAVCKGCWRGQCSCP